MLLEILQRYSGNNFVQRYPSDKIIIPKSQVTLGLGSENLYSLGSDKNSSAFFHVFRCLRILTAENEDTQASSSFNVRNLKKQDKEKIRSRKQQNFREVL